MSSSSPKGPRIQAQDVLVKLTVKHPRPELHYPERRVTLEQKNTSVLIIGRSSKRFDNLEAKSDNCYFDSPVMSREHAKITVDWYHKKLNIKDTGSLHGTYHNSQRIHPRVPRELQQRDTIKFGIDIQRSNELFPPCTVEVEWEWDHLAKTTQAPTQINIRPSFAVPDDSDSSDDDYSTESDIRATIEKIREVYKQKPAANTASLFASSIDLTMDSPMHEPEMNGEAGAPIVIDEDTQKLPQPVSSPREEAPADLDAPHDEDEGLPFSPNNHRQLPPPSVSGDDSDESDDESYDDDLSSCPDEHPSPLGQLLDSCEEDINLSDCESEGNSEEDDIEEGDLESDNDSGSDVASENESLAAEQDRPMIDHYDCESEVDQPNQPDSTLWADESASCIYSQPPPEVNASYQPCYMPAAWQPEQPGVQSTVPRPFRSLPMIPLPAIAWPTLPAVEQGEQGRPNDFRLPSILNPLESQTSPLPEVSNDAQSFSAIQSMDYSIQREELASSLTHWQKAYVDPKPATELAEKDSQNDGPSAEALGHLTGKLEFFAAREHNKATMRRQEQRRDFVEPTTQVSKAAEVPAEASTSEPQLVTTLDGAATLESVKEVPKSTNVAQSVWSASGTKFLNTPQEFPLSDVRNTDPELDMTSAYQFHQSKLASSQSNNSETAQPASSEPEQAQETTTSKSPKRKAADISTLVPEEEAAEAATAEAPKQEGSSENVADEMMQLTPCHSPSTIPVVVESVDGSSPPPSKRMRSFLNKAGYFLGGSMITAAGLVTALAATAPAL
ncbi:hypothetical protein CH063_00077 [Colletotrichum higginsianum]|uniref:FHA domain-containing protein n=2 Tax=Colletotrichum higginsianum TaxID=80884 RepID=H1VZS6_COLHI|nr:FHA domain-containing protein [Colletotrichum higginsianum IMI 349063]OBR07608.1 FHA domain-containing protein [Colletotrichum higginsianum IMI 349063]TIC92788.1 Sarcolemmal membrane-associated protein [Colletotrichum higginsianum]CCF45738.1 hypothetical protein CH063_00077 [Colletotrichum higginsianum]